MSNDPSPVDRQRAKVNEFMQLLPLTLAIAGLPNIEAGRLLNEDQMNVRATALRTAFKVAKSLLLDIAK
jgi:hypothetical protein